MEAQYTLLGFLQAEPNYGYELKKLYDKFFGSDKPILPGQIYSTLSRLERDGKVEEVPAIEPSEGPARVRYDITTKGKQALEQWLICPEEPAPNLHATLYIKTVLALLLDGEAAEYLQRQRHAHIARMRELTKTRRSSKITEVLLIDHAIFHLEADLRWIDMTSTRLTKLKQELEEELCQ